MKACVRVPHIRVPRDMGSQNLFLQMWVFELYPYPKKLRPPERNGVESRDRAFALAMAQWPDDPVTQFALSS